MAKLDKVTSGCLPFILSRPISEQPPSNRLPFALNRPLGQLGDVPPIELPQTPTPPKSKRKMSLVAGIIQNDTQNIQGVAKRLTHTAPPRPLAHQANLTLTKLSPIHQCTSSITGALLLLSVRNISHNSQSKLLANYNYIALTNMVHLPSCQHLPSTGTVSYNRQSSIFGGVVCQLFTCRKPKIQECIIPAAIAQLSNSGIHEQVSIVMRWADKYNLKLANLGDIWQINDKAADGTDDAWRAIVQSVALDVKVDDGVPVIWQTVGLDRYLDI